MLGGRVTITKPSKWFSSKKFKRSLSLPRLQAAADEVTSPALGKKGRRDELREVFDCFDRDKDGKISGKELRSFFASIGEHAVAEKAEAAIADLDTDGDLLVDFEGFLGFMQEGAECEEDELRLAFEAFEVVKGSGRITPVGLQQALGRLGDEKTVEECDAMIRAYDLDGDGELDFHEFRLMMT